MFTTLMLGFLGGQAITYPYSEVSVVLSIAYFSYTPLLAFWAIYSNSTFNTLRLR